MANTFTDSDRLNEMLRTSSETNNTDLAVFYSDEDNQLSLLDDTPTNDKLVYYVPLRKYSDSI